MCLAVPAKILEINGQKAKVDFGSVSTEVNISLIESPKIGDYVIVHAGYAIQVMDAAEAAETLELFQQILSQDSNEDVLDA